jgi:hypothetical protein
VITDTFHGAGGWAEAAIPVGLAEACLREVT